MRRTLARLAKSNAVRESRFASVEAADIAAFRSILGDSGVVEDEDALTLHNQDWLGKYSGSSRVALRPKTTEEVAAVMAHCNERRLAVVPQGGNTGLVGGSVPLFDEVVISTSRMDTIESFDDGTGILVCQAGCVLEKVDNWLQAQELPHVMPLDLGAKGSCQIGGNVATNAGGVRYLRYGSLHGSVLGIEAVMADGTIIDTLSAMRKDNTGYDLKQLFIGSEGHLGIVTKISLLCPRQPSSVQVAFLGLESYDAVQEAMALAKGSLGEVLSAAEFQDRGALEAVLQCGNAGGGGQVRDPLSEEFPFYMLIETSGASLRWGCTALLSGSLRNALWLTFCFRLPRHCTTAHTRDRRVQALTRRTTQRSSRASWTKPSPRAASQTASSRRTASRPPPFGGSARRLHQR